MALLDSARPVGDVPKHLIVTLYSAPGVGKTIALARTANKTLLVTDERASVSLSQFPELAATVDVIDIASIDQLNGIIRELYQGGHGYDHLMLDVFDGIINMKLKEQRKKVDFKRGHEDISSLEDYNLLSNHMHSMIANIAKLPLSVSFTSHERIPDEKSYAKGDRLLRPSIPFRVFEKLNGYSNVVGYMKMVKNKEGELIRAVALQANDEFAAKNHLRMAPLVSDDKFVATIREWKGI